MTKYLCPFDFLQFGPLLAVHASIAVMVRRDGTVYSVCIKEITEPLVIHKLRASNFIILSQVV